MFYIIDSVIVMLERKKISSNRFRMSSLLIDALHATFQLEPQNWLPYDPLRMFQILVNEITLVQRILNICIRRFELTHINPRTFVEMPVEHRFSLRDNVLIKHHTELSDILKNVLRAAKVAKVKKVVMETSSKLQLVVCTLLTIVLNLLDKQFEENHVWQEWQERMLSVKEPNITTADWTNLKRFYNVFCHLSTVREFLNYESSVTEMPNEVYQAFLKLFEWTTIEGEVDKEAIDKALNDSKVIVSVRENTKVNGDKRKMNNLPNVEPSSTKRAKTKAT